MKLFKRFIFFILITFNYVHAFSQNGIENSSASESNIMTDNGKIMVVMAVVVVIVLGLFIYLTNLDRKISRLEKKK